ncbi:cytochrome c-type biogenesis protein [Paracoccus jeotgali]|uniref:Cytochrome c-type biogenesis protein n=1 Tax=Paracoccus jeotgali TaxID=2065379 RepID=A0A2K9MDZ3_9RHOB|nr:cytochrome c-type biogenesis protein [Paracoccus jeotgali]AUM73861.1 cytochrome C biogenesis protein CcdA [Paracoccus jeotgali]
MIGRLLLVILLTLSPAAVFAVQPDEVLSDPQLESRARELSKELRCPVCQGETIDESNAAISRDLRLYVRERLVAGDSDAEVLDAVTDRFGEFVLFSPRATGGNLILYLAGPVMALLALLIGWRFLASRRLPERPEVKPELSEDEQARLDEILRR